MTCNSFDAIVLIAGEGKRSGLPINKVFYKIQNKPIFMYSVEKFLKINECKKVIIVYNENDLELLLEIIDLLPQEERSRIVTCKGGKYRYDSVNNAIHISNSDVVLIHDGARPIINEDLIIEVFNTTMNNKASGLAVKVKDTIKMITKKDENSKVVTLDRNSLYISQTPQGCYRCDLIKAISLAKENSDVNLTDDLSFLEKYLNINPILVCGEYTNIKVTTNEDIKILEEILKEKNNIGEKDES